MLKKIKNDYEILKKLRIEKIINNNDNDIIMSFIGFGFSTAILLSIIFAFNMNDSVLAVMFGCMSSMVVCSFMSFFYNSGLLGSINYKLRRNLKKLGISNMIKFEKPYKNKTIKDIINNFNSLTSYGKEYAKKISKENPIFLDEDIMYGLLFEHFKVYSTKDNDFKLLLNYIEELKTNYSEELNIHIVIKLLIENYLEDPTKNVFFNNKLSLIEIIQKEIKIEDQQHFAIKIEDKINMFNQEKNISHHFEKLKIRGKREDLKIKKEAVIKTI
jgi:hypothetical protein